MRLFAAIALSALALCAPALAETNVGVTAAVNQDAKGTVGANVRTISLGDSVVFNQRIQTGGTGLVQVLLADGTTFMVGPNSDLVIDSFVYDPNAGTAQVTASFTKGVLRFIGGQTSKTPDGVTINTPVGTMGIRGAMVDVVLDPPAGTPPHVDMLFGNEVTLAQGKELLGRLYAAGYSLALGADGSFEVLKTPPGWGSQIQAALAGTAGSKGGAPKGPSDGDVKNSEVAGNNSGQGANRNTGGPPLTKKELDALLYAAAHYDELKQLVGQGGVTTTKAAYVGGVIVLEGFGDEGDPPYPVPLFPRENGHTGEPALSQVGYDAEGAPVGLDLFVGQAGESGTIFHLHFENGVGVIDNATTTDPATQSVPATGSIARADINPEELPFCQCSFIDWGFWNFGAAVSDGTQSASANLTNGAWVSGDLTSLGALNGLQASETAIATYDGIAAGTVTNVAGNNHSAVGDLYMTWSFASRNGTIEINHFDGRNMYGDLGSSPTGIGFGGWLSGGDGAGAAVGNFVNDGATPAAGVIGSFGFVDSTADWYASGVFFGGRGDDLH